MDRIYLSPPQLNGRERELLLQAFDSNWITTLGPQVNAFEAEMASKLGMESAVALSSGTAALHLSMILLGVKPGDTVFCSDLTFAASANPITYCGATPVFIDSSADTWNMDPDLLEEALRDAKKKGKLPRAVIVVDLYGQSADYGRIEPICADYGVALIEDAAEALGATYGDRSCGSFGEMGIISFNGNKIITTSGGGMLVSNSKQYTERARFLATQARDPFPYYEHSSIGYNYRLSNLLAAVGRAQLEHLEEKIARRKEINGYYRTALADVPGLSFPEEAPYGRSNSWLTTMMVNPDEFGARNEDIRLYLEQQNIEARHIWKPMHMQPVFGECTMYGGAVSSTLFGNGLCLPSGSGLRDEDLERICSLIREVGTKKHTYEFVLSQRAPAV